MLDEIDDCIRREESFAFETTLAGLTYIGRIRKWQELGYHVSMFFLLLPTPEVAIARVSERVKQGGHDIPVAVIRRRFDAGIRNFETTYKHRVDSWAKFDNLGVEPILLEWGEN